MSAHDEESGFFGGVTPDIEAGSPDRFHDFREIYVSWSGFVRIFTAKRNGRIFVFKCLREEYAGNPIALSALRKEYDCGYAVDSPYVVHTHDFATIEGLGPSIRLEFCPGESLADIIERNDPLGDGDVDSIVNALIKGVADIHSVGIVHRDIKPTNIVYSASTKSLRIIDFGSADALDFTILHEASGTERFTPPEVADNSRAADAASDFYAVGMTLSLLCAVASPSRRSALNLIAAEMIAKRVIDCDSALAIYKKSITSTNRKWIWIAAIVAAVTGIGVLVAIPFGQTEPDKATIVTPERRIVNNEATPKINEKIITYDTRNKGTDAQNRVYAKEADKEIDKKAEWPSYVLPEEKMADEYGVTMAEAKYTALFKLNPVDNYTVERTDAALLDCKKRYYSEEATPEEEQQAYEMYNSATAIPKDVTAEVMKKYPNADRRRVTGISHQRVLSWHKDSSPLRKRP